MQKELILAECKVCDSDLAKGYALRMATVHA